MSGFKKLRLDPEISKSLSNQQGACGSNDSLGRGYVDSSSFSSSTTTSGGGNGASTMRRNSAGPFRTRYSQPLGSGATSFSRFSPYYFGKERRQTLKVPLIRARRDDSDSERPSSRASLNSSIGGDSTTSVTSTTAQRIIETLQNLSTPVINAGKIRIDQDIKAVQPFFGVGSSSFRTSPGTPHSRSVGPPKMCSSLLMSNPSPANQISPMADQRRLFCIPKMVDAATNTDKEVESNQSSPQPAKIGNEGRNAISTKSYGFSASTGTSSRSITHPASSKADKDNSDDEEFHDCSSEFTFSSPWSPDTFNRYFTSEKDSKSNRESSSAARSQQQSHLINGYKEDAPTSKTGFPGGPIGGGVSISFKPSSSPSQGGGLKPAGSGSITFGTPASKDNLKRDNIKLSSTDETSSKKQMSMGSTFGSLNDNKSSSPSTFGSSASTFTSSSPSGFTTKSAKADTEVERPQKRKYSFGDDSETSPSKPVKSSSYDVVDVAKTNDNPIFKPVETSPPKSTFAPLTVKSSGPKWNCPTCCVPNAVDAPKCVCCSEKNPNATSKADTPSVTPLSAIAASQTKNKWRCPTCMADNELEAAVCVCCSEKNPKPVAAKKWRCPTCMVDNDPAVLACVCCSEKNPAPVGSDKKESSAAAPATTFKFGLSAASSSASTSSTFSFGAKPAEASSTAPSFSFGAPATAGSSVPKSSTDNVSSFKFGATTTTTAPASGAPVSQPAVTPFSFGTPSTTISSSTPNTLKTSTVTQPIKFGETSSKPSPPVTSTTTETAAQPTTNFKFGMSSPVSTSTAPSTFSFSASSAISSTASETTTPIATASRFGSPAKPATLPDNSSKPPVFGSSTFSSGTSGNNFSFGNPVNPPNVSNDSQKSGFGFGGASPPKQPFSSTFSFGNSQQTPAAAAGPITTLSTSTPALNTAPSFTFGSSSASTVSPFGQPPTQQQQQPAATSPPSGMFQFGGSATPAAPIAPASTPSFSLTPNLNFGGATPGSTMSFGNPTQPTLNAGAQPPPLFQFSAASSPGDRKIKKAVRRTRR